MTERFSTRYGHAEPDAEITIREGDPGALRGVLVDIAYECGISPGQLRTIVCSVLRVPQDRSNWSDFPNIDEEVRGNLEVCYWSLVYDVIQEIYDSLVQKFRRDTEEAEGFAEKINDYFRRRGYGWQLVNGAIEIRGSEAFEAPVRAALEELRSSGRSTAHSELQEAINDISRRPEPDVTGAIQHSIAALECLARDVSGDGNETLGDLLKKNPALFPKPLGDAVHKLWGYASNQARHLKEGSAAEFEESEFVVHLASALCNYLIQKFDGAAHDFSADDPDDLPFD